MIRRGSVVTCQFGLYGQPGYKKSVPVKVVDIKVGKHQVREYWVRVLGLLVIGVAKASPEAKRTKKTDLYCPVGKFVGCHGQMPHVSNVVNESDALAYLGYSFE